jgi:hypothetical protein
MKNLDLNKNRNKWHEYKRGLFGGVLVSQEKEKKIVTGPKYGRSVYMYEYRIMKTIQLYKKEGWGGHKERIIEVNMFNVHYMNVWKHYNKTPFVQLLYANKSILLYLQLCMHQKWLGTYKFDPHNTVLNFEFFFVLGNDLLFFLKKSQVTSLGQEMGHF